MQNLINLDLGNTEAQYLTQAFWYKKMAETIFGIDSSKVKDPTSKEDWDRFNTNILNGTHQFFTVSAKKMEIIREDYRKRNPNPKAVILSRMFDAIQKKLKSEEKPIEELPPSPAPKEAAVFQVFLAKFTDMLSEYLKQKKMHPITWVRTYTSITIVNDTSGRIRAARLQKNGLADRRKNIINFLTTSRNSTNSEIKRYASDAIKRIP